MDWSFPAFMVVTCAHYLPFSHLYGMRVFIPLGAGMWFSGLAFGLWEHDRAVFGAVLTGVALLVVVVKAPADYRREFAAASEPRSRA